MRHLKLSEAAEVMSVSVATVRRRISEGKIPVVRDGSRIVRVRDVDIDRYMAERCSTIVAPLRPPTVAAPGRALPAGSRLWDPR